MGRFVGNYGYTAPQRPRGLGLELEPRTLALGIGALLLATFLFGAKTGPKIKRRRLARLDTRISKARRKVAEMEKRSVALERT